MDSEIYNNLLFFIFFMSLIHTYLLIRFIIFDCKIMEMSTSGQNLKWILIVSILPVIGYCLFAEHFLTDKA